MNAEEDLVAGDIATFLRERLPELNRRAEWLTMSCRLGPGVAREMLSELYLVLQRKWATDLVLADTGERVRFAKGVLANLAKRRVENMTKGLRFEPLPEDDDPAMLAAALQEADIVELLISGELHIELHRSLEALTPEERLVVTLKYLDQDGPRNNRQVAEELGVPEWKISRLYRSGLARIRPHLLAKSFDASDLRGGNR